MYRSSSRKHKNINEFDKVKDNMPLPISQTQTSKKSHQYLGKSISKKYAFSRVTILR